MVLQLDNGVSAKEVADLTISVVNSWYGYGGGPKDKLVMHTWEKTAYTAFAINALGDLFANPVTAGMCKHEALITTTALIKACWTLYSELDASLDKAKKDNPAWPFQHMSAEEISAKVDCLHDALVLLRLVLGRTGRRAAEPPDSRELRDIQSHLNDVAASIVGYEKVLAGDLLGYSPVRRRVDTWSDLSNTARGPRDTHLTMETVEICLPQPEQPAAAGNTTGEGERVSTDSDTSLLPQSELDKCILFLERILQQMKALPKSGDNRLPEGLAEEYRQARKALDSLILNEEERKAPASRRQSFQMGPVKAYLRRAKYSWKDWLLLGPMMKPKKDTFTTAELHQGRHCPFPDCGAHTIPTKGRAMLEAGAPREQCAEGQVFEMPGDEASPAVAEPAEPIAPGSTYLSATFGRGANLSFTTIYTGGDDDTSSCHSCSSGEPAAGFCVVRERDSDGRSPLLANESSASAAPKQWGLPGCIRSMPKEANDAIQRWTTLLD